MRTETFLARSGTYTIHLDGDDPGKPFAVFLHGGPGFNSRGERQLLGGRFASSVNTLWFDTLGCGEFERASKDPYSWATQLDDIASIIRRFAGGPVHLIGHCSAVELSHDLVRQGLVRSAVWISPIHRIGEVFRQVIRKGKEEGRVPVQSLSPEQAAAIERFLATPEDALRREDALVFLQLVGLIRDFHEMYWTDGEAMNRYLSLTASRPFSPEAFLSLAGDLFERGPVATPAYDGIPVLMLRSDRDPVAPWDLHGGELLKLIPHAEVKTVPGAGHWLQFQNPDACVRETLEFLSRAK